MTSLPWRPMMGRAGGTSGSRTIRTQGGRVGPLGQAIISGVLVAMAVALGFLIVSYPDGRKLVLALILGALAAAITYLRARRA